MATNTSIDYDEPRAVYAVDHPDYDGPYIAVPFWETVTDRDHDDEPEPGTVLREGVEYYSERAWDAESDPEFVEEGGWLKSATGGYAPDGLRFEPVGRD